jgi:hypothetical protein
VSVSLSLQKVRKGYCSVLFDLILCYFILFCCHYIMAAPLFRFDFIIESKYGFIVFVMLISPHPMLRIGPLRLVPIIINV